MNRTSGGDLAKDHPCGEIENMGFVSIEQPLDLKLSLTMGQAFRWQSKTDDGWYSGRWRHAWVGRWEVVYFRLDTDDIEGYTPPSRAAGCLDYRIGGSGGTMWKSPTRNGTEYGCAHTLAGAAGHRRYRNQAYSASLPAALGMVR